MWFRSAIWLEEPWLSRRKSMVCNVTRLFLPTRGQRKWAWGRGYTGNFWWETNIQLINSGFIGILIKESTITNKFLTSDIGSSKLRCSRNQHKSSSTNNENGIPRVSKPGSIKKKKSGTAKRSQMAIKTPLREIQQAVVYAIASDTHQGYQKTHHA